MKSLLSNPCGAPCSFWPIPWFRLICPTPFSSRHSNGRGFSLLFSVLYFCGLFAFASGHRQHSCISLWPTLFTIRHAGFALWLGFTYIDDFWMLQELVVLLFALITFRMIATSEEARDPMVGPLRSVRLSAGPAAMTTHSCGCFCCSSAAT